MIRDSAFIHLNRALFLGRNNDMGMFTVYCDDSGTDTTSRVAAVSGFISNVGQWELFNREWTQILKEFRIAQMHRADLESFKGEFLESNGWGPRRRTAILKKLHSIMKRRAKVAIGSSIIRKDFDKIVPPVISNLFGGVYGWCAHECIVLAKIWAEKCQRGPMPPFQWVFEAGTIGEGQVGVMFKSLFAKPETRAIWRIGGWSFQGKEILPLQAADVMAYEVYKHVENQILDKGEKRDVRRSMIDLYRPRDDNYLKCWSRERLVDWVNTATLNGKPLKDFK